jgi:hypothetical protein
VADGRGGHAGGGTASRLAVETIQAYLQQRRRDPEFQRPEARLEDSPLPHLLREAVEAACMAIFQQALATPDLAGMGTTATTLWLQGHQAFVAHVGDSRAYLLRGEGLVQLSDDHSLVNEQLRAGLISPEEARRSRFKNVITRSVGFEEDVLADLMGLAISSCSVATVSRTWSRTRRSSAWRCASRSKVSRYASSEWPMIAAATTTSPSSRSKCFRSPRALRRKMAVSPRSVRWGIVGKARSKDSGLLRLTLF